MKSGRSASGRRTWRSMLFSLRQMRRHGMGDLPGVGMRMPMLLTNRTLRDLAARVISWKSLCARLWYHQSCPQKQMISGRDDTTPHLSGAAAPGMEAKRPMSRTRHRNFGPALSRSWTVAPPGAPPASAACRPSPALLLELSQQTRQPAGVIGPFLRQIAPLTHVAPQVV